MTLANVVHAIPESRAPAFLQNGGATGLLLRQVDWSAHPLGPPEHWPVMLQNMTAVVLNSRQPMFVCWGPDHHNLYNDGYAEICGTRHPTSLGAPILDVWDDIRDVIEPLLARAYAGESIRMDDLALTLRHAEGARESHFAFTYTPLRDEAGLVRGLLCVCEDTTQKVMLTRDLEHERARLGQMFEQSPNFVAMIEGPDHIFRVVNPAFQRLTGGRDIIGKSAVTALPEFRLQGYIDLLDQVWTTGTAIRIDGAKVSLQRVEGKIPEDRVVDFALQPLRNSAGDMTGIYVGGVDVTDRSTALSALQTSEQFLRSVLGASPDCIKVLDLDGRLTYMSTNGRLVMELSGSDDIQGRPWLGLWQDGGNEDAVKAVALAKAGSSASFQGYANTFAGNPKYWDVRVTPIPDDTGQPARILVVSRDISYLKQVESEREQVMQEMAHRLRNAFGMVQSVVRQTLRQAKSLEEASKIISGRVMALADAQDILTRSVSDEMQIDAVVQAALLPYRSGEGRFAVCGPNVTISGRQGLGLSLGLHELCTNAVKHGALSDDAGKIEVNWTVNSDGAFAFCWRERGGPPVALPTRNGFGKVLIEQIVASYFNGSASLEFDPAGVVFNLSGKIAPSTGSE